MVLFFNKHAAVSEKCYGGTGKALIEKLAGPEKFYQTPVFYGTVQLGSDDTVGDHQHKGNMEIYTIIKGKAIYNDNGTEIKVSEGDTTIVYDGEFHGIRPDDCDELIFAALIINRKPE